MNAEAIKNRRTLCKSNKSMSKKTWKNGAEKKVKWEKDWMRERKKE